MTGKKLGYIVLSITMLLLIAGCECTAGQFENMVITGENPSEGEILNTLFPTFTWSQSVSCQPGEYNFRVLENVPGGSGDYDTSPDASEPYTWDEPTLEGGREYIWSMQASTNMVGYSQYSEPIMFYTGPVCSGEVLVAPELAIPHPHAGEDIDDWITHDHLQEFKWSYPGGCLPLSYDYQFANDMGFTDIILSGTTAEPYAMHIFESFPNCSSLFWRVAANDGTSVGPWSDPWQFHWVTDETCWQNHYISDDSANISVRLYSDYCSLTGYVGTENLPSPGCVTGNNGLIQADGVKNSLDGHLNKYKVDLGSGPCPSTGLDHKNATTYGHDLFHVLTPGTYCISITKDQMVEYNGVSTKLTSGIWTDPPVLGYVAQKTIELGPGLQDIEVNFGWDKFDRLMVLYPLPQNLHCRLGPDPICDPLAIPMEGEILPIIARDQVTEWKMAAYNGQTCFVYLEGAVIDEALFQQGEGHTLVADLPIFEPQPPCLPPTPEPRAKAACSSYTTADTCPAPRCTWHPFYETTAGGNCSDN